jgi:hypothetical protein
MSAGVKKGKKKGKSMKVQGRKKKCKRKIEVKKVKQM